MVRTTPVTPVAGRLWRRWRRHLDDGTRCIAAGLARLRMMAEQNRRVPGPGVCQFLAESTISPRSVAESGAVVVASLVWRAQLQARRDGPDLGATESPANSPVRSPSTWVPAVSLPLDATSKSWRCCLILARMRSSRLTNQIKTSRCLHPPKSATRISNIILDFLWATDGSLLEALTGHDVKRKGSRSASLKLAKWLARPSRSLPPRCAARARDLRSGGGGSISHAAIFDAFPQIWALAAGAHSASIPQGALADVEHAWRRARPPWPQDRYSPVAYASSFEVTFGLTRDLFVERGWQH